MEQLATLLDRFSIIYTLYRYNCPNNDPTVDKVSCVYANNAPLFIVRKRYLGLVNRIRVGDPLNEIFTINTTGSSRVGTKI